MTISVVFVEFVAVAPPRRGKHTKGVDAYPAPPAAPSTGNGRLNSAF
jgi:hypothetical protein